MTVRLTVLIRRKPGTTVEEFNEYWSNNHGKLFASIPGVRNNLIRYSQYHILTATRDGLAATGMPMSDFDGAAEFWAETEEDLTACFNDEQYKTVVIPDEEKFLDRSTMQILIGVEEVKFVKE